MGVYFIAVALAMIMIMIDETKSRKKFVLNKCQYWICMVMAAFILLSLVVWPYQDVEDLPDDRWNDLSNQFYYALGRPAWGVGLALLTFGWKYMDEDTENNGDGQKSMVKAFLSLEVWQPLGKLTYVMYLIHIIVYIWWMDDIEMPAYYSEWNELMLCIGVWFIVASLGLVLWFVVEKPLNNMVTMCMARMTGMDRKRGSGVKKLNEPLLGDDCRVKHLSVKDDDEVTGIDRGSSINAPRGYSNGSSGLMEGDHSAKYRSRHS